MSAICEILCIGNFVIVSIKSNATKWVIDVSCVLATLCHFFALNDSVVSGCLAACIAALVSTLISTLVLVIGRSADSHNVLIYICRTAALVSFNIKSCFIDLTNSHAHSFPGLKVLAYADNTAGSL